MGQLRNEYVTFGALMLITATGLGITVVAATLLSWAAYLSPWMPQAVWLWLGVLGFLGCGIAASSAVSAIAAVAGKPKPLHRCLAALMLVLCLELLLLAASLLLQAKWAGALQADLHHTMADTVAAYPGNVTLSMALDEIQHEMSCCGVESYKDWFTAPYSNGDSVPSSCCLLPSVGCGDNLPADGLIDIINMQGCVPVLTGEMLRTFKVLSTQAVLPICVLQILMMAVVAASQRRIIPAPLQTISASIYPPSKYSLLPSTR